MSSYYITFFTSIFILVFIFIQDETLGQGQGITNDIISIDSPREFIERTKHFQPRERIFYSLGCDVMKNYCLQKIDFSFSKEGAVTAEHVRKELTNDLNIHDFEVLSSAIAKYASMIDSQSWGKLDVEKKRELELVHTGLWRLMLNMYLITENDEIRTRILDFWSTSLQNENHRAASQIAAAQIDHVKTISQLNDSLRTSIKSSQDSAALNNALLLVIIQDDPKSLGQITSRMNQLKSLPDTLNNACLVLVLDEYLQFSKDREVLTKDQLLARKAAIPSVKYYSQLESNEDKLRFLSRGFAPSDALKVKYIKN